MCSLNFFLCFFAILAVGSAQFEGESCTKEGVAGVCVNIRKCQSAIDEIKRRITPQTCSFDGTDPIVCCVRNPFAPTIAPPPIMPPRPPSTPPPRPVASKAPDGVSTTTEEGYPVFEYDTDNLGGCSPISAYLTSEKTGMKAWDKCIEYQEQLVFPCKPGVALVPELSRANNCKHNADELIVGGVDLTANEYPHMALLGYGPKDSVQWLCSGALISDWFILTAGHCTYSRELGPVTFAILGSLKRTDNFTDSQKYGIARIIKHPEYRPPAKYNDIALLRTDRQIALSEFIVPACLHTGSNVKDDKSFVTGWRAVQDRGNTTYTMQKVTLHKFTSEECLQKFPPTPLMVKFNTSTQICYGDKTESKDTCQSDSDSPIHIKNQHVFCMWTVIGVKSFGKACGTVGEPGMYTRVSFFLPWIESIVWA